MSCRTATGWWWSTEVRHEASPTRLMPGAARRRLAREAPDPAGTAARAHPRADQRSEAPRAEGAGTAALFRQARAAGSHRDSRSMGEARAEEAGAAGAAASVAAVIVRFTSDNVRSRILSSPACGGSPGQAISFLSPARARLLEKNLGD